MRTKRTLTVMILFALLLSAIVPFSAFAEGDVANVAKIGETAYPNITKAFEALKDGDTLELLTDVTTESTVKISKSVTINGNGHTYSYTGTDYVFLAANDAGTLTFKNLTISSTNGGIKVQKNVNLVMESDVKMTTVDKNILFYDTRTPAAASENSTLHIKGGEYSSSGKGIISITDNINGRKLRIDGGKFTSNGNGVMIQVKNTQVVIYNGLFVNNTTNHTMPVQGASTLTMYGGAIISNHTGSDKPTIRLESDTSAAIYGGYVVNNGKGNALLVQDGATAEKTITLYGGTYMAKSAEALKAADDKRQVVINGGQFYGAAEKLIDGNVQLNGGYVTVKGETVESVTAPTALRGASARLVEGSNGIRFEASISKAAVDFANSLKDEGTEIGYGTVIAPTDQLAGISGMSMNVLDAMGKSYENVVAKDGISTDAEGNVRIRAALINLKTENIGRAMSAVSYISYVKDGVTVYIYSAYVESQNSRSMSYVAQAALNDVRDAEEGLYIYAFNGKFSPYTDAQRAILQGYLDAVGN